MNSKIVELIDKIRELEDEVEAELDSRREELHFRLERHKIHFEEAVLAQHRRLKTGLVQYILQARLRNILTAPIVYSAIFPLLLLDIFVTIYQITCFPIYGIPRVRRSNYLVFDRSNLAYLNIIEKFHCFYCSYANGLGSYVREIVALTEQYWCPIKHARRVLAAHSRYARFIDFGDAEGYRRELERVRHDFGPDKNHK